jgi:hypothetical protein
MDVAVDTIQTKSGLYLALAIDLHRARPVAIRFSEGQPDGWACIDGLLRFLASRPELGLPRVLYVDRSVYNTSQALTATCDALRIVLISSLISPAKIGVVERIACRLADFPRCHRESIDRWLITDWRGAPRSVVGSAGFPVVDEREKGPSEAVPFKRKKITDAIRD